MIYGISGKKQSGKDTVCKIIQYIDITRRFKNKTDTNWTVKQFANGELDDFLFISIWQRKQFATKLKEICCILLNCNIEQFEDDNFKSQELGEQWWYFKREILYAKDIKSVDFLKYPYDIFKYELSGNSDFEIVKLTPRKLLQLLGTDCGAYIIHPNIWVNALMNEYKPKSAALGLANMSSFYPDLIITDLRYKGMPGVLNTPYEIETIRKYESVLIRVERPGLVAQPGDHISETALDDYKDFDHVIVNDGTIEDLISKVEAII